MKILVIEDEKVLSSNIVKYLSDDNYRCEQAYNFSTAMEKITLYNYDCILLDLNLPGGDGIHSYSGDMHPPKKQICLYFMT